MIDEDPALRIKSFATIKIRGVSANYKFNIVYNHANLQLQTTL